MNRKIKKHKPTAAEGSIRSLLAQLRDSTTGHPNAAEARRSQADFIESQLALLLSTRVNPFVSVETLRICWPLLTRASVELSISAACSPPKGVEIALFFGGGFQEPCNGCQEVQLHLSRSDSAELLPPLIEALNRHENGCYDDVARAFRLLRSYDPGSGALFRSSTGLSDSESNKPELGAEPLLRQLEDAGLSAGLFELARELCSGEHGELLALLTRPLMTSEAGEFSFGLRSSIPQPSNSIVLQRYDRVRENRLTCFIQQWSSRISLMICVESDFGAEGFIRLESRFQLPESTIKQRLPARLTRHFREWQQGSAFSTSVAAAESFVESMARDITGAGERYRNFAFTRDL